jgi:hypothetical protein
VDDANSGNAVSFCGATDFGAEFRYRSLHLHLLLMRR